MNKFAISFMALSLAFIGEAHADKVRVHQIPKHTTPVVTNVTPLTSTAPAPASSAGYTTNTFSSSSFSGSDIDLNGTYASGFQWYKFNCDGIVPGNTNLTFNSDGSVSVGQGANTYNAYLTTAACTSTSPYFKGIAFGGGAYIEATIKFTAAALPTTNGWPSFWTDALESTQWPGQKAGYDHHVEADIMEYFEGGFGGPLNQYSATDHEWYGVNETNDYAVSGGVTVSQASFAQYHTYGMLWIPATSTKQGSISYYMDEKLLGTEPYSQFTGTNQKPPPSAKTPWAFGILDQQHLILYIGSNNTYPITVENVNIWQTNGNNNMSN